MQPLNEMCKTQTGVAPDIIRVIGPRLGDNGQVLAELRVQIMGLQYQTELAAMVAVLIPAGHLHHRLKWEIERSPESMGGGGIVAEGWITFTHDRRIMVQALGEMISQAMSADPPAEGWW